MLRAHSALTPVAGSENMSENKQTIGTITKLHMKSIDATMYSVFISLQKTLSLMDIQTTIVKITAKLITESHTIEVSQKME